MSVPDPREESAETLRAWDLAAGKYAQTIDADVTELKSGVIDLSGPVHEVLLPLISSESRLIHIPCSHGQTALGLWRSTGCEVVGIDGSAAMLEIAGRKARLLDAPSNRVRFVEAEFLSPPPQLAKWATVVLTDGGSLPWVRDLTEWSEVVAGLLAPDGRLVLYEAHPLNWIWDPNADTVQLRGTRSYFDAHAEPNDDFPASAVSRFTPADVTPPRAWEHHWTLAQILTAVLTAGFRIEKFEEYPEHFWPEFERIQESTFVRLPHTFLLVAKVTDNST